MKINNEELEMRNEIGIKMKWEMGNETKTEIVKLKMKMNMSKV